uniref:Uncharacterized protein n=1 Tax=Trichogramma kaykai TaxID=54128 RepID=A0ABD2XTA5_9HYME
MCWTRKRDCAADTADRFTSERAERLSRTAGQIDGRSSGMKCITFACQYCTYVNVTWALAPLRCEKSYEK